MLSRGAVSGKRGKRWLLVWYIHIAIPFCLCLDMIVYSVFVVRDECSMVEQPQ